MWIPRSGADGTQPTGSLPVPSAAVLHSRPEPPASAVAVDEREGLVSEMFAAVCAQVSRWRWLLPMLGCAGHTFSWQGHQQAAVGQIRG